MRTSAGAESTTLRPGAMLGRYELVVRLARGVTTEIWLAKGRSEKAVALKALRLDVHQTVELLRSFAREALIASRLHHPNIVELTDSGRIGVRHYMAMEYVDGMSLAQLGQRRSGGQRLSLGLLARLLQQVCLGLHHAHELGDDKGWLGFVHRDLCPEHILVSAGGVAKLIDFGAARMRSVPDGVGPLALRTRYAAPERVQGLSEDRRSDVYSVGVILYEQATGTPPFQGTDLEMISQIVEGKPRDPRQLVPGFPEPLAKIISRAMALHPAERYANAQTLAADLAAFAAAQNRGAELDTALESALRSLFDAPAESEPPWEPQPMPVGAAPQQETPSSSSGRERFAPDADFSNDDITRPSVVMLPDNTLAASPQEAEAVIEAKGAAVQAGGEEPPEWLSERQQALSRAPDIFGAARRGAGAAFSADPPPERQGAFPARAAEGPSAPDVFSLYTRGASNRETPAPPRLPPPPGRPSSPAVQRFDRGLELLGAKLYDLALAEWEEACRLDPGNRLYQTNLKRLRAQIAARVHSHPTESE